MEVTSIAVAVVVLAVLIVVLPFVWRLLALWVCPAGAKGTFQKRVVTELLTIKDKLEKENKQASAKLVKESVIALISGDEPPPSPVQPKNLFGQ